MNRRAFFGAIGGGLGVPALTGDVYLFDKEKNHVSAVRAGRTIWFVDIGRIMINDLIAPHAEGKIVRCYGDPHEVVKVYDIDTHQEVKPRG